MIESGLGTVELSRRRLYIGAVGQRLLDLARKFGGIEFAIPVVFRPMGVGLPGSPLHGFKDQRLGFRGNAGVAGASGQQRAGRKPAQPLISSASRVSFADGSGIGQGARQ